MGEVSSGIGTGSVARGAPSGTANGRERLIVELRGRAHA